MTAIIGLIFACLFVKSRSIENVSPFLHPTTVKLNISKFYNARQRTKSALKYGIWYAENENYFRQFFALKQEELPILEYFDQFSRLQDACGLEDDKEHDLISFLRGLRSDIVERMNGCKTIHKVYWEAICVERMLKQSHLEKVTEKES